MTRHDGAPEFSREVWSITTGFEKGIFKNNVISNHFLPPGNIYYLANYVTN
jgi:hypothetical protein